MMFTKKDAGKSSKKTAEEEEEIQEAKVQETKTRVKGKKQDKDIYTLQLTPEEMDTKIKDLMNDKDRELYLRVLRGQRVQEELEACVQEREN